MNIKEEFLRDLIIDSDSLDEECLGQSILYAKWSLKLVEFLNQKDRMKEKLDLIKSRLDRKIRLNPELFGLEEGKKPTETAISNLIISSREYLQAHDEYLKVSNDLNILQIAKESFQMRKNMIENLVELHQSNYFSNPKIPSEIKENSNKRIRNMINSVLNKEKLDEDSPLIIKRKKVI